MLLVEVRFAHYAPKDSEEGIKELILATNLEQAVAYIDNEHMFGHLKDCEEDIGYASLDDDFWEQNPSKKQEAEALGLEVNEYGSVEGPSHVITKWLQRTTWEEVSEAYYGVTQWDWSKHQEISDEDAAVLLKLGIAKDVR